VKKGFRYLVVILLICTSGVVYSAIEVEEENIPEKVFQHFYEKLPAEYPIVLDFRAGRFTDPLKLKFGRQLLEDGNTLYEQEPESGLHLSLDYDSKQREKSSGFFLFRKYYLQEEHSFTYQVTELPEGRIIRFDDIELITVTKHKSSNMKWYDPLLITVVVGSLAYLFYFGGN
jgi:hypothetical protein